MAYISSLHLYFSQFHYCKRRWLLNFCTQVGVFTANYSNSGNLLATEPITILVQHQMSLCGQYNLKTPTAFSNHLPTVGKCRFFSCDLVVARLLLTDLSGCVTAVICINLACSAVKMSTLSSTGRKSV